MGYKATEAVLLVDVGNGLRKCVLFALAAHADNESFESWPSFNTLAKECNIARSTVIDHLNALVKMGAIEKRARHNEKGRTSNGYKIVVPEVVREPDHLVREPDHPSPGAGPKSVNEPVIESVNESVSFKHGHFEQVELRVSGVKQTKEQIRDQDEGKLTVMGSWSNDTDRVDLKQAYSGHDERYESILFEIAEGLDGGSEMEYLPDLMRDAIKEDWGAGHRGSTYRELGNRAASIALGLLRQAGRDF